MKKSQVYEIVKSKVKQIFEGENDELNKKFEKKVMGDKPTTPSKPNRIKSDPIKPTGDIEIMNWNRENGEYVVDINDDYYKDENEEALRTTFDEDEVDDSYDLLKYIDQNRDKLNWKVVHA